MNNRYWTDYSLFLWLYTNYVSFYEGVPCDVLFPFKEWRLRLSTQNLVMNPSHQSSFLSCTRLFGPLVSSCMIQHGSLWKAPAFSWLPEPLGGASRSQWMPLWLTQLKTPLVLMLILQRMLKCAADSFTFLFFYLSPNLSAFKWIFTFKEIQICKHLPTFYPFKFIRFTQHGARVLG